MSYNELNDNPIKREGGLRRLFASSVSGTAGFCIGFLPTSATYKVDFDDATATAANNTVALFIAAGIVIPIVYALAGRSRNGSALAIAASLMMGTTMGSMAAKGIANDACHVGMTYEPGKPWPRCNGPK